MSKVTSSSVVIGVPEDIARAALSAFEVIDNVVKQLKAEVSDNG